MDTTILESSLAFLSKCEKVRIQQPSSKSAGKYMPRQGLHICAGRHGQEYAKQYWCDAKEFSILSVFYSHIR